jgi:predicted aconitase
MLALTAEEQRMLDGDAGPAVAMAMRIVTGLGRVVGAERLVEIGSAHIDGCLHHGQAGVDFAERLVELGGAVAVPTTLNVGSLDLLHPELVRTDAATSSAARRLMDAYRALGAWPTWTCAPYQAGHRPKLGEHVAWAESNAIVFVNSVLGARSDRYGDFLDICAALTGRAPYAGLHLDAHRRGEVVFDLRGLPDAVLGSDLLYPVLGHLVGARAQTRVPVIVGLPADAGEDDLKALGATAASSGGVALFHAVGVTPEAPTLEAALHGGPAEEQHVVTAEDLRGSRAALCTAAPGARLDAVSLGTPHFSVAEFAQLAAALGGGEGFASGVDFYVSTSRDVLARARANVEACEAAGVTIVVDTCTYVTPILEPGTRVVATSSGKWAWYAPANLGVDVVLGSIDECVAWARAGRVGGIGAWPGT